MGRFTDYWFSVCSNHTTQIILIRSGTKDLCFLWVDDTSERSGLKKQSYCAVLTVRTLPCRLPSHMGQSTTRAHPDLLAGPLVSDVSKVTALLIMIPLLVLQVFILDSDQYTVWWHRQYSFNNNLCIWMVSEQLSGFIQVLHVSTIMRYLYFTWVSI